MAQIKRHTRVQKIQEIRITPRPIAGSRNIEARPVLHLKRRRERFGERSQMPTVDGSESKTRPAMTGTFVEIPMRGTATELA